MLGAIVGDIVGSTRERHNVKSKYFELLPPGSRPTDDTVMTLAVAKWLVEDGSHNPKHLVACMQEMGRRYPRAGYGRSFRKWLASPNPVPYNSWGNGSAMRVSPCALFARSLSEALDLAALSAVVTHNHPEGVKGAQAVAAAIYLAGDGVPKGEIKRFITEQFGYSLDRRLDDIRPGYTFDVSCQGSCPEAIIAYLESTSFEDAIRNAISLGGDSDTIGAMTGAIAAAEYGIPEELATRCTRLMPDDLLKIMGIFENVVKLKL